MKTMVRIFLLLAPIVFCLEAESQDPGKINPLRERIIQAKLFEIRRSLNLDQATMARFRPIYIKYEREISSVSVNNQIRLMRVNSDSLTAEEAERLILVQLENARKLISIREKYYHSFKTVLTPQQVVKLYQTESEIRQKVMQELRRRRLTERFNQ